MFHDGLVFCLFIKFLRSVGAAATNTITTRLGHEFEQGTTNLDDDSDDDNDADSRIRAASNDDKNDNDNDTHRRHASGWHRDRDGVVAS